MGRANALKGFYENERSEEARGLSRALRNLGPGELITSRQMYRRKGAFSQAIAFSCGLNAASNRLISAAGLGALNR